MMKKKMVAAAAQLSWQDLTADLLDLVLPCLPSLADRLRLRAACRSWRAGGRRRGQPLPPPLPWFAFRDGSLVDHDGAAVRCATPILGRGVVSYLVVDNLAFLLHDDGGCSLLNPLSTSAVTPLLMVVPADVTGDTPEPESESESESSPANRIEKAYAKLVLSSPLDSSEDAFIAVVTPKGFNVVVSSCKRRHGVVSIISCPSTTECPHENWDCISDIAFLQGKKLYALTKAEGLHVLDLDDNGLSNTPDVSSGFQQCIADDDEQQEVRDNGDYYQRPLDCPRVVVILRYLVESNGRLLMVRRWMSCPRICLLGDIDETYRFEVVETDLTGVHGRWTKVDSLDGQAIFLSSECSKSVTASQCAGGIQEDCIGFSTIHPESTSIHVRFLLPTLECTT
ncbi:hypothetical protein ABZP36_034564 [Zizania latifolia]